MEMARTVGGQLRAARCGLHLGWPSFTPSTFKVCGIVRSEMISIVQSPTWRSPAQQQQWPPSRQRCWAASWHPPIQPTRPSREFRAGRTLLCRCMSLSRLTCTEVRGDTCQYMHVFKDCQWHARATTLRFTILHPLGFACSLACIGTKRIARGGITWPCTVTHVRSIHSGCHGCTLAGCCMNRIQIRPTH